MLTRNPTLTSTLTLFLTLTLPPSLTLAVNLGAGELTAYCIFLKINKTKIFGPTKIYLSSFYRATPLS